MSEHLSELYEKAYNDEMQKIAADSVTSIHDFNNAQKKSGLAKVLHGEDDMSVDKNLQKRTSKISDYQTKNPMLKGSSRVEDVSPFNPVSKPLNHLREPVLESGLNKSFKVKKTSFKPTNMSKGI